MTVTYSAEVATASIIGFNGLMFRFRGSVWKCIWPEFLIFATLYTIISFVYRMLLSEEWRHRFALFSMECEKSTQMVPLEFILGFYVNVVVNRWSSMIDTMPYVDGTSLLIATLVRPVAETPEAIEHCRMHRRTLARYFSAFHVVTLRDTCVGVFKRFPTFQHIVQGGLLTQDEADIYEANTEKVGGSPYFTIPKWLFARVGVLHRKGLVKGYHLQQRILDQANVFRGNLMWLTCFDWIPVPLAYTQVVVLAVRTYFLACLFGRQYLDPSKHYGSAHEIDIYIPPFTILEFIFYVGWLKVAETLINPLGEDDDDFEVNHLCENTLAQSMAIVDGDADAVPALVRDVWWDKDGDDVQMPYTYGSEGLMNSPQVASVEADNFQLTKKQEQVIVPNDDEETAVIRQRMSSFKGGPKVSTVQLDPAVFYAHTEEKNISNLEQMKKFDASIATLSVGSFDGAANGNGKTSNSIESLHKV